MYTDTMGSLNFYLFFKAKIHNRTVATRPVLHITHRSLRVTDDGRWTMDHSVLACITPTRVLLALLTLLAFALRAFGFWWGSPYDFHNDEAFVIVHTLKMIAHVQAGELPDTHTMIYGVWPFYQLGLIGGLVRTLVGFVGPWLGIHHNIPYMYIGRLISALYGALGVPGLYMLGKRMFDRQTGLRAAAFWAVMPLSVRDSHFATVDIQFAVWLVFTYIVLWNVAERGRRQDYILAAVMMGLALATRLSALPIFAAYAVALFIQHSSLLPTTSPDASRITRHFSPLIADITSVFPRALHILYRVMSLSYRLSRLLRNPKLYTVPLAALAIWGVLSVPVLDDLPAHLAGDTNSDLNVQSLVAKGDIRPLYTVQFELTHPYVYHLTHLFPWAMTWPLALLAYAGWLYSLWRMLKGDRRDWLLAAWTLPYFITVGGWYVKFFRYIIPLLPFMALYAARLATHPLIPHPSPLTHRSPRIARYVTFLPRVLATLAFLTAFLYSLAYLHIYIRPDTRLQTLRWMNEHIPPGATVMLEFDASNKFAIHPEWFGLEKYHLRILNHYEVNGRTGKFWQAPPVSPQEKWAYMTRVLDRADYVIISEAWADVFPRLPHRFPAEAKFYRELFDGTLGYQLVATFRECPQLGPWRLCDDGAEMSWRYFDHPRMYVFRRK